MLVTNDVKIKFITDQSSTRNCETISDIAFLNIQIRQFSRSSVDFRFPNISLGLIDTSIGQGKKRRKFIGKSDEKKKNKRRTRKPKKIPCLRELELKRDSALLAWIVEHDV